MTHAARNPAQSDHISTVMDQPTDDTTQQGRLSTPARTQQTIASETNSIS